MPKYANNGPTPGFATGQALARDRELDSCHLVRHAQWHVPCFSEACQTGGGELWPVLQNIRVGGFEGGTP
jgi:hypothetical protein